MKNLNQRWLKKGTEDNNTVRVNIVTNDTLKIERIRYYFRKRDDIELKFSKNPLLNERVDIYLVPAGQLQSMFENRMNKNKGLPVIGFGSPSLLRSAFLAGCSDYLKNPWTIEELEIRIDLIKNKIKKCFIFPWGKLTFDGINVISAKGKEQLSFQEYKILRLLLSHRGEVVPRDVLFYSIWNNPGTKKSRIIDVHISALRKKLKSIIPGNNNENFIISARRIGYIII